MRRRAQREPVDPLASIPHRTPSDTTAPAMRTRGREGEESRERQRHRRDPAQEHQVPRPRPIAGAAPVADLPLTEPHVLLVQ